MSPEEMELRIKHLEWALSCLTTTGQVRIPGLCVNAGLDRGPHPHWEDMPMINWDVPIIFLPGQP